MAKPNYTLGRGEIRFARFDANGNPEGIRYLGNSPEFNIGVEANTLDHYKADHGLKEKDESITLEVNRTGSMVLDDIQPENVALYLFGASEDLVVAAANGVTDSFTATKGLQHKIGRSDTDPAGLMNIDPANFTATVGATTLVEGTDYDLDAKNGFIVILETATNVNDGDTVNLTFNTLAYTRTQIRSGDKPVEGELYYVEDNPAGQNHVWYFPKVKITANGDMAMKGDEWRTIPLSIEVLKPTDGREAIYCDNQPA